MTTKERQNIATYVTGVASKLNITYPMDFKTLKDICDRLGGTVDFEKLPSHIDGKVISFNDKKPKIFQIILNNSVESESRQLFTLAHEIGHLFLHTKYFYKDENENEEYIDSYTRGGDYTEKERQADCFAGALLMPEHLYLEQVDKYADYDEYGIKEIADYFKVSVKCATIRGKWLSVFRW